MKTQTAGRSSGPHGRPTRGLGLIVAGWLRARRRRWWLAMVPRRPPPCSPSLSRLVPGIGRSSVARSCSASSSQLCYSSRSDARARGRPADRPGALPGRRCASSCSCGWRHCSSIRASPSAYAVRWPVTLIVFASLARSLSTSDVVTPFASAVLSRRFSSSLSSSCSISSRASSQALQALSWSHSSSWRVLPLSHLLDY